MAKRNPKKGPYSFIGKEVSVAKTILCCGKGKISIRGKKRNALSTSGEVQKGEIVKILSYSGRTFIVSRLDI